MRKLKQISLAVVLMLALSTCALAGIIETPPAPTPPPSEHQSATGTIETLPSAQQPSDPMIEVALALLQSVLF